MRPVEIEAWAFRVIDALEKKQPVEDSCVELKREWTDPAKAARQLAGHANAARGDDLLWLIGADEKEGIVGAEAAEFADWLAKLQKEFESVSPAVVSVNVHHRGVVVVALHVTTDRVPFRVRVPEFGSKSGVSIQWETPWRDGNRTRTATREELLRMLVPKIAQPRFEILQASATADKAKKVITVQLKLYIVPPRDTFYVYPKHKALCLLRLGESAVQGTGTFFIYSAPRVGESVLSAIAATHRSLNQPPRVNVNALPQAVEVTDTEVIVRAPGNILVHDTMNYSGEVTLDQPLTIETFFESAHDLVTCHLTCFFAASRREGGNGRVASSNIALGKSVQRHQLDLPSPAFAAEQRVDLGNRVAEFRDAIHLREFFGGNLIVQPPREQTIRARRPPAPLFDQAIRLLESSMLRDSNFHGDAPSARGFVRCCFHRLRLARRGQDKVPVWEQLFTARAPGANVMPAIARGCRNSGTPG